MATSELFPADIVQTNMIQERIAELESDHTDDEWGMIDVGLWDEADRREYRGLAEVMDDLDNPRYNTILINERHFRDHIKDEYLETSHGVYAVATGNYREWKEVTPDDLLARWPFNCIDWDAAAEECRSDYSVWLVAGVTY